LEIFVLRNLLSIPDFSSCKKLYPSIIVKFIPSINISYGIAEANKNFNLFADLRRQHPDIIRGIDLSGDPTKGKFSDYKQIYTKARAEGFRLALHCAEVYNEEEILDMLEFMTSEDRIGHGTFIDGILMSQVNGEPLIYANLSPQNPTQPSGNFSPTKRFPSRSA
jgi:hypothetical protein